MIFSISLGMTDILSGTPDPFKDKNWIIGGPTGATARLAYNTSLFGERWWVIRPSKVDISTLVDKQSRVLRHNRSATKLQHMRRS
jgi:hypothetical protein